MKTLHLFILNIYILYEKATAFAAIVDIGNGLQSLQWKMLPQESQLSTSIQTYEFFAEYTHFSVVIHPNLLHVTDLNNLNR